MRRSFQKFRFFWKKKTGITPELAPGPLCGGWCEFRHAPHRSSIRLNVRVRFVRRDWLILMAVDLLAVAIGRVRLGPPGAIHFFDDHRVILAEILASCLPL